MQRQFRVVLVDIVNPHIHKDEAVKNLDELKSLVATYGGINIVEVIQHRLRPDKATFIGSGKVLELAQIIKNKNIDTVVINAIVNPSTLFNLTQQLWDINPDIQVWDRIDLILHIFDKHAQTSEAKLQIEIARMQHMGPRIYGLGTSYFSRQGGGIGTRGAGQTNIELMKLHWKNQIKKKKEELDKLTKRHALQIERRKNNLIKNISIIGYTNAGKTSLFNLLTKRDKTVKNALFVTLDTVTGKIFFPNEKKEALVSDTIGFIKDLPTSLIDSFKSTLMESISADLVLHIIDVTDPQMNKKIETVEDIINELKIHAKKIVYVFNKVDISVDEGKKLLNHIRNTYSLHSPQFISVNENYGIDKLKNHIEKELFGQN